MEGRLVRVEPIVMMQHAEDLAAAWSAAPDDRDWTYLPEERPLDLAGYRGFVGALVQSEDPRHHAIVARETGRALGTAALMRIVPAHGVIEVGHIVLSPALQRTTAATEALYLLMCRVFDELGYRRFEWKCDRLNSASCRAAERLGFAFEGIFRRAIVTKGRSRDTAWYAMTDTDWPRVRDALQTWLDPANFDNDGRQLRRLAAGRQR